MNFSPFAVTMAACAAALAMSQAVISTVKAQPITLPEYRVQVERQKVDRSVSGLLIQGRVRNTGSKPLTYTQVTPLLADGAGKVIFQGQGYLTVSPLLPGQSADFRACETNAPRFATLHIAFREAGHPVVVVGEHEAAPTGKSVTHLSRKM